MRDRSSLSYAHIIRLPQVGELLLGACLARLAVRMFALAVILYALNRFESPWLVGWVSFAVMGPGLMVGPIAGAVLDRLRAPTAIIIDMLSSAVLVSLFAAMDQARVLNAPLLLVLVASYSLTSPLSGAGIRVLLPRLVPGHGLEIANALDTASYAGIEIVGPALAGGLFAFAGPNVTMLTIAVLYVAGSLSLLGLLRMPRLNRPYSSIGLLAEAAAGLRYLARNPSLRGLAGSYSLYQTAWGILLVAVPVFVQRELGPHGRSDFVVGLLWAGSGLAAGIGSLIAGKLLGIGRDREIICVGTFLTGAAIYPLSAHLGLFGLALGLTLTGFFSGPIDVGVLTLRQRRTDPAWLGRVLTVSMSLNLSGLPLGSAIGGWLVSGSLTLGFAFSACLSVAAGLLALLLIPAREVDARGQSA
jgi:MFS family permease